MLQNLIPVIASIAFAALAIIALLDQQYIVASSFAIILLFHTAAR